MRAFRMLTAAAAAWLAFVCCTAAAAETVTGAAAPTAQRDMAGLGDLDGDGAVSIVDAILTLKAATEVIVGSESGLTADQQQRADIDGDGEITILDAMYILQHYTYEITDETVTWEQILTQTVHVPLSPYDADEELFGACYFAATRTLGKMTLEEKVSQMFLVSYPGYSKASAQVQSELCPCGYVLFADDFRYQTPASLSGELRKLKANSQYGLLLGGDEEGGGVVRASMFSAFRSSAFPSPQRLYQQGGMAAVMADAEEKAVFLKNIELNYNLAPVADMPKKTSSYIYDRSLGQNAEITSEFTAGVVKIMNSHGMLSTLKHFPGYGDNLDTHSLISVDNRTKAEFEQEDFLPFISGIKAGAPMVMVNHNIINCMDGTKPASLSEEVHRVLREELDFSGLIVTDALTMGAIKKYADDGEAAVQAVLCGNDLIATTEYLAERQEVLNAVESGRIPEIMINDAVRRILACKYYYALLA